MSKITLVDLLYKGKKITETDISEFDSYHFIYEALVELDIERKRLLFVFNRIFQRR